MTYRSHLQVRRDVFPTQGSYFSFFSLQSQSFVDDVGNVRDVSQVFFAPANGVESRRLREFEATDKKGLDVK